MRTDEELHCLAVEAEQFRAQVETFCERMKAQKTSKVYHVDFKPKSNTTGIGFTLGGVAYAHEK